MNQKPDRAQTSKVQRYAIFGAAFGFLFPLLGITLEILVLRLPFSVSNILYVQTTYPLLWVINTAPVFLGMLAGYAGHKQDQLSKANEALLDRENELKNSQVNFEQRANERTTELESANRRNERRTAQFEAIAQIARTISSIQTLDELLPQVTQAISKQFGFYHVGIFLLDNNKEYAILTASNSEGGKTMIKRNHSLPVRGTGIVVSFAANTGQPRIALNVGEDAIYFNNPDLPDTRSEVALPLRIGADVFGVLDVQSLEMNAFSKEDVSILSILADQVGIAIQNARSLQQAQEALIQAEAASNQMSSQQWKQFFTQSPVEGYYFNGFETKNIKPSEKQRAHSLAIPLTLRGTKIGSIKLSASNTDRTWTEDEIAMVEAAAERTSLALESARLLQEAQKRALKERVIGEISAKIGGASSLESIIQTAIQELGNNMPNTDIAIQISSDKPEQA